MARWSHDNFLFCCCKRFTRNFTGWCHVSIERTTDNLRVETGIDHCFVAMASTSSPLTCWIWGCPYDDRRTSRENQPNAGYVFIVLPERVYVLRLSHTRNHLHLPLISGFGAQYIWYALYGLNLPCSFFLFASNRRDNAEWFYHSSSISFVLPSSKSPCTSNRSQYQTLGRFDNREKSTRSHRRRTVWSVAMVVENPTCLMPYNLFCWVLVLPLSDR